MVYDQNTNQVLDQMTYLYLSLHSPKVFQFYFVYLIDWSEGITMFKPVGVNKRGEKLFKVFPGPQTEESITRRGLCTQIMYEIDEDQELNVMMPKSRSARYFEPKTFKYRTSVDLLNKPGIDHIYYLECNVQTIVCEYSELPLMQRKMEAEVEYGLRIEDECQVHTFEQFYSVGSASG